MKTLSPLTIALLLTLSGCTLGLDAREPRPAKIVPAKLGATRNVHVGGNVYFAGQFTQEDIPIIKKRGITRIVTLRTDGEVRWDEKGLVEAAGFEFVSIPFRGGESLTDEIFAKIRSLLKEPGQKTLLHCGSANRVGGAWLPYRVLDEGVDVETARKEAKTIGLRTAAYEERALAYIAKAKATNPREKSVKPGINKSFLDAELDVERFLNRFEIESREVYSARLSVLKACAIKPGQRIADVGAGTGLYTRLFSKAVGSEGWVYAVDIAPRFVDHIRKTAREQKLTNISPVLCNETSIDLPPNSVDFVFVCDTYHHFEFPHSTLASIHRALKPGGTLFLIDFKRVPGVTREWLLNHVRAGKDVFRGEIESAGFKLDRELKVEGLKENYVLRFTKS